MTPDASAFAGRPGRTGRALLGATVALWAAFAGVVVGRLAGGGTPVLALLVPLLLVPVLLWRRPDVGLLLMLAATVLVEQFDYEVGPRRGAVTARLPFFHSPMAGIGITPAELVLAALLLVLLLRCVRDRKQILHATPLSRSLLAFVGLAAGYVLLGISRQGDVKMALWELRPFVYLTVGYVLAAALLTSARAVRAMLWIFVLGCAAKAAYGVTIWWSVRTLQPRPEAVLAHEESFFFGLFLFLTLGLWIFDRRGPLRRVATLLSTVVLLADMVNSRRTAWAILIVGAAAFLATAYVRLPARRPLLHRLALVVGLLSAVYFPAFWSSNGTLAQPARAVRSVVAPDARDEESNRYRFVENANLQLNIQASRSTGSGFGIPILYAIAMVDLRDVNSSIAYIPHNTVLCIWMRTGIVGEMLFLLVIAQAAIATGRLSGAIDKDAALLGAVGTCGLVSYVIMGNQDMGFFWFRIALAMGIVIGAVEGRARALRESKAQGADARTAVTR